MASVEAVLIAADIDAVAANFAEASLCGANNAASKTHLAPHLEAWSAKLDPWYCAFQAVNTIEEVSTSTLSFSWLVDNNLEKSFITLYGQNMFLEQGALFYSKLSWSMLKAQENNPLDGTYSLIWTLPFVMPPLS